MVDGEETEREGDGRKRRNIQSKRENVRDDKQEKSERDGRRRRDRDTKRERETG